MNKIKKRYDIVILGNGFAASVLGTILAKRGLSVLLLGNKHHPQFTIGESTIPQTSLTFKILSKRYSIPEFYHISSYDEIKKHVSNNCGVKRNFGFVYHSSDGEYQANNFYQLGALQETINGAIDVPKIESHLFRQDVDYYLYKVALQYGCDSHVYSNYHSVNIDSSGVIVEVDDDIFSADFIVDGSGFASPFVRQMKLRQGGELIRTKSRSLFTHMIDVKPFDECIEDGCKTKPAQWSEGTLHHLFVGGWLWVIPFNNSSSSHNNLISVGLMLDTELYPDKGEQPQKEFFNFISKFPVIARQFSKSESIRKWVSTGRIQYAAKQGYGDRYCLLSHTYGFIDPLFSRGLHNTLETIHMSAELLLNSFSKEGFGQVDFEPLELLHKGLHFYTDLLVSNAYLSFSNNELWNAWYRIWGATQPLGILRIQAEYQRYLSAGESMISDRLLKSKIPGAPTPDNVPFMKLFDQACKEMDLYRNGEQDAGVTTQNIFELISHATCLPPHYPYHDPTITIGTESLKEWQKRQEWIEKFICTSLVQA